VWISSMVEMPHQVNREYQIGLYQGEAPWFVNTFGGVTYSA